MILLISSSLPSTESLQAFENSLAESVKLAPTFLEATAEMRASQFSIVILDRSLSEKEPHEEQVALAHLGTAIFIEANLALTAMERLRFEIERARKLRARELETARVAATQTLHARLNLILTTLLIDCDQASDLPDLPTPANEKLSSIQQGVASLRLQLAL